MATIAQQRHDDASEKFEKKLHELQNLIDNGSLERITQLASIASFAKWEDAELGVRKIARSTIYGKEDYCMAKRQRMEVLLNRIAELRSKSKNKENEKSNLRESKTNAELRAQAYLNQYTMARAELADAIAEIDRLNKRIAQLTTEKRKVVPLRFAKNGSRN